MEWILGYALGIGIGISLGLIIGRKQKPWDKLTKKERKTKVLLISTGITTLIAGVLLLFFSTMIMNAEETFTQGELGTYCVSGENVMMLQEAVTAAKESECVEQGILKNNYFCNSATGTWWIDLYVPIENTRCKPSCVINITTGKAVINWGCNGELS